MGNANEGSKNTASQSANNTQRTNRAERIIKRMKSFGLFREHATGVVFERATSCRDLEEAFRLVHDVYVEKGYIVPHPNGIRMRHFECSPDTGTFVAKVPSHSTVGVISVIVDSPDFGLPSERIYPEEIAALRAAGRTVCEFSNQAVLPEFRGKGPTTELMRCALAYAYSMGVSDIVFAVSPNVVPFYQMMNFVPIGPVRNYCDAVNDPVVLINVSDIQERGEKALLSDDAAYRFFMHFFFQGNPYFGRLHTWHILNQRMFNDQFEFASLLSKCPDILGDSELHAGLVKRLGPIYELSNAAISISTKPQQTQRVRTHTTLRRPLSRPVQNSVQKRASGGAALNARRHTFPPARRSDRSASIIPSVQQTARTVNG